MIELKPYEYNLVRPLVTSDNGHYPLLQSVIDGINKGRIYVDRVTDIQNAFIDSANHFLYLLGGSEAAGFTEAVLELLCRKQDEYGVWFGMTEAWKKRIMKHCDCELTDYHRYRYRFSETEFRRYKADEIPYKVEAIERSNLFKVPECEASIAESWSGQDNFFNRSFGIMAVEDGNALGYGIIASITKDNLAEISIETNPEYQGRGIARYLSYVLINQCLERGLTPKWDCLTDNIPSVRLAQHLGFQIVETYTMSVIAFY